MTTPPKLKEKIDNLKEKRQLFNEEQFNRNLKISELCWKIFNNSLDGKELMDLLIKEFLINRPVASNAFKESYGDYYIGIREGQNDLIRDLFNRSANYPQMREEADRVSQIKSSK